jgi:hypothetical protein
VEPSGNERAGLAATKRAVGWANRATRLANDGDERLAGVYAQLSLAWSAVAREFHTIASMDTGAEIQHQPIRVDAGHTDGP